MAEKIEKTMNVYYEQLTRMLEKNERSYSKSFQESDKRLQDLIFATQIFMRYIIDDLDNQNPNMSENYITVDYGILEMKENDITRKIYVFNDGNFNQQISSDLKGIVKPFSEDKDKNISNYKKDVYVAMRAINVMGQEDYVKINCDPINGKVFKFNKHFMITITFEYNYNKIQTLHRDWYVTEKQFNDIKNYNLKKYLRESSGNSR